MLPDVRLGTFIGELRAAARSDGRPPLDNPQLLQMLAARLDPANTGYVTRAGCAATFEHGLWASIGRLEEIFSQASQLSDAANSSDEEIVKRCMRSLKAHMRPEFQEPWDAETWSSQLDNATSPRSLAHLLRQFHASLKPASFSSSWPLNVAAWQAALDASPTAATLANLLVMLEVGILWSAVIEEWRVERPTWTSLLQPLRMRAEPMAYQTMPLAPTPGASGPPTYRSSGSDWDHVRIAVLVLEENIKMDAFDASWAARRLEWRESVRQVGSLSELVPLVAELHSALLASWMYPDEEGHVDVTSQVKESGTVNKLAKCIVTLSETLLPSAMIEAWTNKRTGWLVLLNDIAGDSAIAASIANAITPSDGALASQPTSTGEPVAAAPEQPPPPPADSSQETEQA